MQSRIQPRVVEEEEEEGSHPVAQCGWGVLLACWVHGVPDTRCAQWVREERFRGQRCAVWQNVSYWGRKKNVYTLRVGGSARGPVPLHYEVRGFNSLLGSHYDKYEIDYAAFSHRFSPEVFQLPDGERLRSRCHPAALRPLLCSNLSPISL